MDLSAVISLGLLIGGGMNEPLSRSSLISSALGFVRLSSKIYGGINEPLRPAD